ncbi:MAG: methyltransferase [Polyangiales bacterium]
MLLCPAESLCALDDPTLRALSAALRGAGYSPNTVADVERLAPGMLDALRLPLVHAALREAPSPARDLARLFLYDDAVPADRVRALLGDDVTAALQRADALRADADGLRASVLITPFYELLLVSDPLHAHADAVMGPGPTTLFVAEGIPHDAGDVLDVGCGAGTFALLAAARGAASATGVDISPRAVAHSALHARLTGLTARFALSDLTAAVADQRFDLVLSQPAFIAQPPDVASSTFAHGGARGDELLLRLLGELPARLREGGAATVLVQSLHPSVPPLLQRLRAALGAPAMSCLLASAPSLGIEAYSIGYAALVDPSLGDRWRDTALRYRAHLRALGGEGFALALLRLRNDGLGYSVALSAQGLRGFDADALRTLDEALTLAAQPEATLLQARVRGAPGVTWTEARARPDSSLEPRWTARLRSPPLADRELTEATWVLLGMLDGAARIADAVAQYAEVCGATPREVAPQVLGFVRENLACGLLVRA